jgi:hypothetical protein
MLRPCTKRELYLRTGGVIALSWYNCAIVTMSQTGVKYVP